MSEEKDRLRQVCDARLLPLVDARTDAGQEEALAQILREVEPVIRRVVAHQWCAVSATEGAEDIAATVTLRLLRRLHAMLVFEEDAIGQLDDYVATLTYRTVYDFFRSRFPARTRLRNRLRLLLKRHARFAIWTEKGELLCGLRGAASTLPLREVELLEDRNLPSAALDQARPASALEAIFLHLGRPVAFEPLQVPRGRAAGRSNPARGRSRRFLCRLRGHGATRRRGRPAGGVAFARPGGCR